MRKVQAMATRIQAINPGCQVVPVDDFISADNIARLLPATAFVIDAIDDVPAKGGTDRALSRTGHSFGDHRRCGGAS